MPSVVIEFVRPPYRPITHFLAGEPLNAEESLTFVVFVIVLVAILDLIGSWWKGRHP